MASVTCPDCTRAASTWNWHGYRNGCPDCQIRAIAQAPRNLREIRYDQIRRSLGEADAQTLIARIGLARVEVLESTNEPRKWTHDELRGIRDEYRAKTKALKAKS